MYRVQFKYTTGDSYTSYDTTTDLEEEYDDIEKARDTVRRLAEHAAYSSNRWRFEAPPDVSAKEWYTDDHARTVKILTNNGKEWVYTPPYIGVFEYLHNITVLEVKKLPSVDIWKEEDKIIEALKTTKPYIVGDLSTVDD